MFFTQPTLSRRAGSRLNWQVTFLYATHETLSGPTSCMKECVNPPHPTLKITLTEGVPSYQSASLRLLMVLLSLLELLLSCRTINHLL